MFDVPVPVIGENETVDEYLAKRASGITDAWGRAKPFYIDVHDLPLDLRTSMGKAPIAFLSDLLRTEGLLAVPVAGTVSERGRDYLIEVRRIIARDRRGACLRLVEDDFDNSQVLRTSILETLELLQTDSTEIDVAFDFRYVGQRSSDVLRTTIQEGVEALLSVGRFRNIIVAGSSIPDVLGKADHGKVRRESRIEFSLWTKLAHELSSRGPIVFCDYGVVSAHYAPPGKPVHVPARIRYTTANDHVFYRANRKDYPQICRQLVSSGDFGGEYFSAGDLRISQCAKESTGPGGPAEWVESDTNHHLEFVSEQVWRYLSESRLLGVFALPESERVPWLQEELV